MIIAKNYFAAAALVAAAGSAYAQITVVGTDSWQSGNADIGGVFDASISDKLVIVVTGEHGFNQTANGFAGDVFYDGIQLTRLINRAPIKAAAGPPVVLVDDTFNALYYLDNPGSFHTGGVITTSGFSTRGNMALIGLTGTADGAGNTVIGDRDTNTADLTTSAGSIVIGSYGLGGSGNTAQLNTVSTPDWDAEFARQENGSNWDGHVVAYQNNVAAGTTDYTFDDSKAPEADGRTGRHVIAAEFLVGPPPPVLTLQVDTVSGAMSILGDDDESILFNYYQITSAGESLNLSGWNSLADQDYEGNGPANGSGNGWEQAGGAGAHALAEAYLLGDSTVAPAEVINMGSSYNTAVDAQDLVFTFRTDVGREYEGTILYVQTALPGDTDGDGDIDDSDLGTSFSNYTGPVGAVGGKTAADGDTDGDGDVDDSDLGTSFSGYTGPLGPANVPEPASLALLGLGGLLFSRRRRATRVGL